MNVEDLDKNLLIAKYLAGEATEQERHALEQWIDKSADNKQFFEEMSRTWDMIDRPAHQPLDIDIDAEWNQFQANIADDVQAKVVPMRSVNWLQVAAVAFLGMAVAFVLYYYSGSDDQVYYASTQGYVVNLEDGSKVTLNADAELVVSEFYDSKNRNMTLVGEGFFEVEKSIHPFIVTLNDSKVEVVGTSFNIRSEPDGHQTEVIVATGNVKFASIETGEEMALAPGDKATITSSGQIIKVLNQDPNFRSWMTRSMVFEDQSLSEVIQVLNKVYDTQIIFDIPPPDCMVTVSFDNQSLEAVMNVLSGTLDFNFEHRDDAYVITDAACH